MQPIEYADATAEVRAIFDDIKNSRNVPDVNNFWKYLANEPRMLSHVWSSIKDIMGPGGHLDPLVKELIYVAVSVTNSCEYCMASHGAAARKKGATEEMMNELFAIVGIANMTNKLAEAYRVPVDAGLRVPE
ncbi:AhpD family alkylhydroperoxidase [Rhodoligotrophos appendicifer]|uniref:carboxymuconolactone decarboxylase family protein n=1 Tax=Rhodoligotrophos appendicifer TaxID=987056 RepID=UPI00117E45C5|nr:carboxymuconolactone decarboxylase family protein [Rhodoligotrophos appendicifer]